MNLEAGGGSINTLQRLGPCPGLLAGGARESDDEKLRHVRQIVREIDLFAAQGGDGQGDR